MSCQLKLQILQRVLSILGSLRIPFKHWVSMLHTSSQNFKIRPCQIIQETISSVDPTRKSVMFQQILLEMRKEVRKNVWKEESKKRGS